MAHLARCFSLGFLLACTAVIAQTAGSVERPDVKPGDRWTYRRVDYWTNRTEYEQELVVTFADSKAIHSVAKRAGQEKEVDLIWTSEWNAVSTNIGTFETDSGVLRFPLVVGNKYKAAFRFKDLTRGAFEMKHEWAMTVVGWEEVVVPAGKFRALKLEGSGSYQRLDTNFNGVIKAGFWYVPEVKRWVKYTFTDSGFGRTNFNYGDELLQYKVQ